VTVCLGCPVTSLFDSHCGEVRKRKNRDGIKNDGVRNMSSVET
jgi:hypothetical protein